MVQISVSALQVVCFFF